MSAMALLTRGYIDRRAAVVIQTSFHPDIDTSTLAPEIQNRGSARLRLPPTPSHVLAPSIKPRKP